MIDLARIFFHTWPNVNLPVPPENTSLYMSPKVPSGGLTSAHLNSWTRLWQVQNYEPDPLVASTYGGGALQSFGGYLYWGTMHVPFVAAVTAEAVFHLDFSDPVVFLNTAFGTHRSPSIFRGRISAPPRKPCRCFTERNISPSGMRTRRNTPLP